MGFGESWEGKRRTWVAATSKQEMSHRCTNDKGELAMQRSALISWGASCKRGQQQEATGSSPLPALAHTVITWRRRVKVQGDRELPQAPADLFMCVLVPVQHLPQHRWEKEPRAGWRMRGVSSSAVCKDTIFFGCTVRPTLKGIWKITGIWHHTQILIPPLKKGGGNDNLLSHCLHSWCLISTVCSVPGCCCCLLYYILMHLTSWFQNVFFTFRVFYLITSLFFPS